jgi:DnaK suppressor protein
MTALTDEQIEKLKESLVAAENDLRAVLHNNQKSMATVDLDQSRVGRVSRIDAMQQQAMAQAEQINFEK